jgi:hypothetical protein
MGCSDTGHTGIATFDQPAFDNRRTVGILVNYQNVVFFQLYQINPNSLTAQSAAPL